MLLSIHFLFKLHKLSTIFTKIFILIIELCFATSTHLFGKFTISYLFFQKIANFNYFYFLDSVSDLYTITTIIVFLFVNFEFFKYSNFSLVPLHLFTSKKSTIFDHFVNFVILLFFLYGSFVTQINLNTKSIIFVDYQPCLKAIDILIFLIRCPYLAIVNFPKVFFYHYLTFLKFFLDFQFLDSFFIRS